jgi:hypothetical protein
VIELVSLKAQLAELQSYKAQMANKKSQEIETSKIALKALFENKKALILSSASGEAEVKDYISNLIERLGLSPEADTFDIFLASNKTFSITLGLGTQDECNSMRDQLLSFESITKDSFCGDWNEYIAAFDFKNGQLFATVGQNYFEGEETSNKVISTNKPNTSKTKSPENEQSGAVEETQTATKIQDNSLQNKESQSEFDIFDTEIPSKNSIITKGTPINITHKGTLDFFRKNYKNFIRNQHNEKFIYCRAIAVQLRADTLFFSGEYYEDILRVFLQENAKEANRRGLLESELTRYQLKYKNKFEKTEPNINKRTKWLALELFAKCEGANIIPL